MIRILLNGVQSQEGIIGVDELVEDLELRDDLHGYIYQISGNITFIGLDYDYLRELFDAGYCEDVNIDIQLSEDFGNTWESKAKALIKLAGVKWDRVSRQADCPIVDNSYQSKINNNRTTVFQLGDHSGVVLSKNGVDVSSKVVFHSGVQLFSPFRGRYFEDESIFTTTEEDTLDYRPQPRVGMFIWDALNLLVAMMTDDEVDFASDYLSYNISDLSTTNDVAASMIFSGGHLRFGSTYPKLNFEQTINDMHKLANLWFAMEVGPGGKPRLRIENEDYFRQGNSGVFFDSVKSFKDSVDLGKVYSKVVVGCSVSSSGNFPIGEIPLVNHIQEEFPLSGTCNTSNELNLRLEKLIINTNSIAEALPCISGFSNGGLIKHTFTNGATTSGPHQEVIDTFNNFGEFATKFLMHNARNGEWTYIDHIFDANSMNVFDGVLEVAGAGVTKDYEIYKPTDDTQFNDEVFLIQIDRATSDGSVIYAKKTEIDPPSNLYYYNEIFANYKVIERHMGGVAQSIVNGLSNGDDEFLAGLTVDDNFADMVYFLPTPDAMYLRIRFEDDVNSPYFDTNGNYDPLTGIYSAPQGGYYHAYASIRFRNNTGTGVDFTQIVEITRTSATGDVIESESTSTTIVDLSSHTFTLDRTFYLQEGERLQVVIKKPYNPAITGSYPIQYVPWNEFDTGGFGEGYGVLGSTDLTFFGVDFLFNGGGLVPASDPEEVRLLNFETELSVSRDVFDSILANPFKYYHTNFAPVGINPNYQTGFIGKISRGILNGECTMTQFKKPNGV